MAKHTHSSLWLGFSALTALTLSIWASPAHGTQSVHDYMSRTHQDFTSTTDLEMAVWLHKDGFVDKKEQVVSKLIQKQPDSIYGHFLMAELQLRKYLTEPLNVYQLKIASDLAQQTIELGPSRDMGYVAVAQILEIMGQSANAQKILDIADPTVKQKSWRLPFIRGIIQANKEQTEQALKNFAKALETPEVPKDLVYLAIIDVIQDKAEGANLISSLTKLQSSYNSPLFAFAIANAYVANGQYKVAHDAFSAIYNKDPMHFEAMINDVDTLARLNDQSQAYTLAKKALTTSKSELPAPLLAQLHKQIGLFAAKSHHQVEALTHIAAAVDFTESKFQILADVTDEYRKQKMYNELLAVLDRLNLTNPGYALQYAIRGETLSENLNRHKEAVEAFGDAISLEPGRSEFHNGMGLAYFRMAEYQKALASFNTATKVDPRDSVAHYNEACALARLGETAKSLTALRMAISLDAKLRDQAKTDSDLASLKTSPEFAVVLSSQDKQAAATPIVRPSQKAPASDDVIMINE